MFGFYYASNGVQKLDFRVADDANSRLFCLTVCAVVGVCGLVRVCDTTLVEFCSPISSCDLFILLTDSNSRTSVLGAEPLHTASSPCLRLLQPQRVCQFPHSAPWKSEVLITYSMLCASSAESRLGCFALNSSLSHLCLRF